MATKSIVTRIKNKVDTLAKWQSYTGTLLDGEIAVVRVPTGSTYTNPVTGADEPVVELLMKVGDGTTAFASLPWMSAKASDVYDWAKAAAVVFNEDNYHLEFRAADNTVIAHADLTDIDARLDALESKKITVTPSDSLKPGVVQSVTQGDASHEIDVTYGLIKTADIDAKQVTAAKIADSTITATQLAGSAVTDAKIADGAVTNAKLGTDISSDKINVGTDTTKGLTKKLSEMDAAIAANANAAAHEHPYLPDSTMWAKGATQGGAAESANKVNKKLSIKLNSGTATEFDGSAAKTIDITPAAIGAATTGAVSTLSTQVETNKSDIASLKATVSKGIIFRGEVASAPSGTTYTLKGTSTAVSAIVGDMVICGEKEYIYTAASTWKELGDLGRVTTLETWQNKLQKSDAAVTNQFVTEVDIAADGTVTINRDRPTSTNVKHGTDSTVKDKLDEIDAALASKVASVSLAGGTNNGTLKLTVNGTATDNIAVTGLGSAAYTASTAYAPKAHASSATTYGAGSNSNYGHVKLSDSTSSTSGESDGIAATPAAVKTAYDKAATAAADAASRAPGDHGHGNITKDGTITSTAVTSATGVLVYDSNNKIQRATAANARAIIGAAESGHNHDTRYVRFDSATSLTAAQKTQARTNIGAADSGHTHSIYEANIAEIAGNYVKISNDNLVNQAGDVIIFDCGGAD